MPRSVFVLDTSVLCCWLNVPGKETAGPLDDRWDHNRINELIQRGTAAAATFVLPLTSLIETGNHIAQSSGNRYDLSTKLGELLRDAVIANSPWAAFTEQSELWGRENLLKLATIWPPLAARGITIGDATIKDVAEYYARAGFTVEILTGDAGLKAYQPVGTPVLPRRRR